MNVWMVVLLWCAWSSSAQAALTADAAWEVRPTNGLNTNGACYDTGGAGTDYSQQNAAQLSLTDLATSGAGVTTLTSVTGGFTSVMVDNCIRINSGTNFTVGYYEITVFTNTNTVTLDRTPSAAGAGSSGAGSVGGATLSISGQTTTTLEDSLVAGQTIHIKNEAWNEAVVIDSIAGGNGTPITWEGYNTTRGDDPTEANRPRNNRASAAGDAFRVTVARQTFKNLWASNAGDDGFDFDSVGYLFNNCRSSNNGDAGFVRTTGSAGNALTFFNSESDTNTGVGVSILANSAGGFIMFSYLHDNTSVGFGGGAKDVGIVLGSIIEANASDGVLNLLSPVSNSVFDGNTGASSDGLSVGDTSGSRLLYVNSIITNNGAYGVNRTTTGQEFVFDDYNNYNGNVTAATNNVTTGESTITTDPSFTNRAGGDFTVASGSGVLGTGALQTISGATGDYQWNIGVDQDDVAAGGATDIFGAID